MKKRLGGYKLNRDTSARRALFTHLMVSLVEKESIITTRAKAFAVRPLFEKLLTKARKGTVPARRQIKGVLGIDSAVKKLVDEIAPRYQGVNGGYTKLIPYGNRQGDNAPTVKLSLTKLKVEKPAAAPADKKVEKKEKTVKPAPILTAPKAEKIKTVKIAAKRAGKRGDK